MDSDKNGGEQASWTYQAENTNPTLGAENAPTPVAPPTDTIQWTGSEFLAQHKNLGWYLGLFVFTLLASGLIYLLSHGDILSVSFIVIMSILFGIIAGKKPRQLQYVIDQQGISVAGKLYTFHEFKSFGIMHDGAIGYISFLPLQRLRPELSIYYAPEDEKRIFDVLSHYLPYEERQESSVDRLLKKIRF